MQKKPVFLRLIVNHNAKNCDKNSVLDVRGNIMSVFVLIFPKTVIKVIIEKGL